MSSGPLTRKAYFTLTTTDRTCAWFSVPFAGSADSDGLTPTSEANSSHLRRGSKAWRSPSDAMKTPRKTTIVGGSTPAFAPSLRGNRSAATEQDALELAQMS